MDLEIKSLFQTLIESRARTDKSVSELARALDSYVAISDSRMSRWEEAHIRTEQAIANLAVSGNERMKRIEDDLEGLIRQ